MTFLDQSRRSRLGMSRLKFSLSVWVWLKTVLMAGRPIRSICTVRLPGPATGVLTVPQMPTLPPRAPLGTSSTMAEMLVPAEVAGARLVAEGSVEPHPLSAARGRRAEPELEGEVLDRVAVGVDPQLVQRGVREPQAGGVGRRGQRVQVHDQHAVL